MVNGLGDSAYCMLLACNLLGREHSRSMIKREIAILEVFSANRFLHFKNLLAGHLVDFF